MSVDISKGLISHPFSSISVPLFLLSSSSLLSSLETIALHFSRLAYSEGQLDWPAVGPLPTGLLFPSGGTQVGVHVFL